MSEKIDNFLNWIDRLFCHISHDFEARDVKEWEFQKGCYKIHGTYRCRRCGFKQDFSFTI